MVSVEEAAVALGIGRTLAYALVRSGQLGSVRVGRRRLIPVAALDAYAQLITGGAPGGGAAA